MKAVICGFPGIGKSTITKEADKLGLKHCFVQYNDFTHEYELTVPAGDGIPVFDSDSSKFDKSAFPKNYVDHIENVLNQEWMEDVIILVSSHDNVREELRNRGIEYSLVYPQIELKAEYIDRYKERGSPDQFVGMMENAWTKFITDCEEDPTKKKSILSEGEYLVDYVKLLLDAKVAGTESLDNTQVTATIVDVNASNPLVVVEPDAETPPPNDPSVLNTPEQSEAATLTAEGNQSEYENDDQLKDPENTQHEHHVDGAESIGDIIQLPDGSTVDGTIPGELQRSQELWAEHRRKKSDERLELIEAKLEMQNDLDVLEPVILDCQNEEIRSGLEGYEDHGAVFSAAAEDINNRYGTQIEPTLAGLEGFLTDLKEVFKKITGTLKEKPSKATQAKVKKYFFEVQDLINELKDPKWIEEQHFINVGKAKLEVPTVLSGISNPAGMKPIIDQFIDALEKEFTAYYDNARARLASGVKVYNKLKNHSIPDSSDEVKELMIAAGKVTPEELPQVKPERLTSLINVTPIRGELPVLKKDDLETVVDILSTSFDKLSKMYDKDEQLTADGLDWDDLSKFWYENSGLTPAEPVMSAIIWDNYGYSLRSIQEAYEKQMLVIAKFIEMWILSSVK